MKVIEKFSNKLGVEGMETLMQNLGIVAFMLCNLRKIVEDSETLSQDYPRLVSLICAMEEDFNTEEEGGQKARYSGAAGIKLLVDDIEECGKANQPIQIILRVLHIATGFSGQKVTKELLRLTMHLLEKQGTLNEVDRELLVIACEIAIRGAMMDIEDTPHPA